MLPLFIDNSPNQSEIKSTQVENQFHVDITAHEGKIIIRPSDTKKTDFFIPSNNEGNMGCVLLDSKKYLRVSKEALALMQKLHRSNDDIGDISWWDCTDDKTAFAWFGPIFRTIDPSSAEADRDFKIHEDKCTIIPNTVKNYGN